MNQLIERFRTLLADIRAQESAQRRFVRAIYSTPNRYVHDFDKPAYLRRRSAVTLS